MTMLSAITGSPTTDRARRAGPVARSTAKTTVPTMQVAQTRSVHEAPDAPARIEAASVANTAMATRGSRTLPDGNAATASTRPARCAYTIAGSTSPANHNAAARTSNSPVLLAGRETQAAAPARASITPT